MLQTLIVIRDSGYIPQSLLQKDPYDTFFGNFPKFPEQPLFQALPESYTLKAELGEKDSQYGKLINFPFSKVTVETKILLYQYFIFKAFCFILKRRNIKRIFMDFPTIQQPNI